MTLKEILLGLIHNLGDPYLNHILEEHNFKKLVFDDLPKAQVSDDILFIADVGGRIQKMGVEILNFAKKNEIISKSRFGFASMNLENVMSELSGINLFDINDGREAIYICVLCFSIPLLLDLKLRLACLRLAAEQSKLL